jgi:hypothetical protein
VYATVSDLRAEGVTAAQATDARLEALLAEATAFIDAACAWWFEPRAAVLRMDGRGTRSLEPPVPPLHLDALTLDGTALSLAPADLAVVGAPAGAGFEAPRLTLRHGRVFPRGDGNVEAAGLWGYTEADGTVTGRTPLAIRRACLALVLRWLPPLASAEAEEARNRWRLTEERTRDQSYRLAPGASGPLTGDADIDAVLLRYRRPAGLGAA